MISLTYCLKDHCPQKDSSTSSKVMWVHDTGARTVIFETTVNKTITNVYRMLLFFAFWCHCQYEVHGLINKKHL